MRSCIRLCSVVLLTACVGAPRLQPGPHAEIPVFAADDARVATPGFVQQTLRLRSEQGAVTYTLMAFVVGETATLGAMVKGAFSGRVHWTLADHRLDLAFDAASPGAEVPVTIDGSVDGARTAKGAAFRGTAWTNVEVPAGWLVDGAPLALQFEPAAGPAIDMPGGGAHYVVQLVRR